MERLSDGKISLSNGTLYEALTRLLDQELLERLPDETPEESGRSRKAYRLSRDGLAVLHAEFDRLRRMLDQKRPTAVERHS